MKNLKIGTRLASGFGLVLMLIIVLIAVGLACYNNTGDINRKLIEGESPQGCRQHDHRDNPRQCPAQHGIADRAKHAAPGL